MAAPFGNHNHRKHGGAGTRLYNIWKTMRQRCYNPQNGKFKVYGARGITICDEWSDFVVFRRWALESGYNKNLTIDRIDVDGNYEPSNCQWADNNQQANNKTNNVIINYKGEIFTMSEFCKENNLNYKLFSKYRKSGLSIDKLINKTRKYGT